MPRKSPEKGAVHAAVRGWVVMPRHSPGELESVEETLGQTAGSSQEYLKTGIKTSLIQPPMLFAKACCSMLLADQGDHNGHPRLKQI